MNWGWKSGKERGYVAIIIIITTLLQHSKALGAHLASLKKLSPIFVMVNLVCALIDNVSPIL